MILLIFLLIPAFGATIVLLLGEKDAFKHAIISGIISLFSFAYLVFLFADGEMDELFFIQPYLPTLNIFFNLYLDRLSVLFVGLVTLIIPIIVFSSRNKKVENISILYGCLLFSQFALIGLIISGDLFLFYIFFELAFFPFYLMVLRWVEGRKTSLSIKNIIPNILGSLMMLGAIFYLFSKGQTSNIDLLMDSLKFLPISVQYALFGIFILAILSKIAWFPFHFWARSFWSEISTAANMLFISMLCMISLYGLIKIVLVLSPLAFKNYGEILTGISVLCLMSAALFSMRQDNLKKLLLGVSFVIIGFISAGIWTGSLLGLQGAIFLMLSQSINLLGLFFIIDLIIDRTGKTKISQLGGLAKEAPILSVYLIIFILATLGFPFTNGFIGNFFLLNAIFEKNITLGLFSVIGLLLMLILCLGMYKKIAFGSKPRGSRKINDLGLSESSILFMMSLIIFFMGIFPKFILEFSESEIQNLVNYLDQY